MAGEPGTGDPLRLYNGPNTECVCARTHGSNARIALVGRVVLELCVTPTVGASFLSPVL